jgi:hypothetical protein
MDLRDSKVMENNMRAQILKCLFATMMLGASTQILAMPITGDLQLIGAARLTDGTCTESDSCMTNDVNYATTIDFINDVAIFLDGTGSFSTITPNIGTITDFAFSPTFSGPINDFWTVGSFTFDLMSLDSVDLTLNGDMITFINMVGSGVISGTGYDDTAGFWTLAGDTSSMRFSWNGSSGAVPEPATVALLGLGLIGVGIALRKRLT